MSVPEIVIRGKEYPRYLIKRDDKFWDGNQFVSDECDALLYCEYGPASTVACNLSISEAQGETYEFWAPVFITVKAGEKPNSEAVKDWLHKVAMLAMDYGEHGSGPLENSMAVALIDWGQLHTLKESESEA